MNALNLENNIASLINCSPVPPPPEERSMYDWDELRSLSQTFGPSEVMEKYSESINAR